MSARNVPEDSNTPVARTPLAHWHTLRGARFDEINSWQVPTVYSDEKNETTAARSGLGVADVSSITKIMLRGPGVAEVIQALAGNSPAEKPGGVAALSADKSVLACRLHVDQLLLLGSPMGNDKLESILSAATMEKDEGAPSGLVRWFAAKQLLEIDVSSAFACFWLLGPRTDDLLRQLTHFDISAPSRPEPLERTFCAETGLAGVPTILVRPPTPVLPSMRILIGWDVAEYVWEKMFQIGQAWKIVPIGFDALETVTK
jgi:glycine cleavage system aminomethyltransferase T